MKVRNIVCTQCGGKGTVESWAPHVHETETIECPQCGGKRTIAVMVPDEAVPPTQET